MCDSGFLGRIEFDIQTKAATGYSYSHVLEYLLFMLTAAGGQANRGQVDEIFDNMFSPIHVALIDFIHISGLLILFLTFALGVKESRRS